MNINSEKLILALTKLATQHSNFANELRGKSTLELNWKANDKAWSILECLEHLNLYGDFYLPEIERVVKKAKSEKEIFFKPGVLGNYFVKSIQPSEKLNKMKSPKDKNPLNSKLDASVIDRFIYQQEKMVQLLSAARQVGLTQEKTGISLVKWIRIRLGDTFRFVIYHNERHMLQIEKIVGAMALDKVA